MSNKFFQVNLDPESLSQVQSEFSFFDEVRESQDIRDFWDAVLAIVKRIIRNDLTEGQKKIMMLFLNRTKFKNIAAILSKHHRTIYYRYHAVVKKISHALSKDEEFLSLKVPAKAAPIIGKWSDKQLEDGSYRRGSGNALVRVGKVCCPVCHREFQNDNSFKLHLIVQKYRKTEAGEKMNARHIRFIRQQEGMLQRHAIRHRGSIKSLIEKMMKMKTFYLGRTWIYKMFKSENFKKSLYSRGRLTCEKTKKTSNRKRTKEMRGAKSKL